MTLPRTLTWALLAAVATLSVALVFACSSSSKGFSGPVDGSADGAGDGGDGAPPGQGFVNFTQLPDAGGSFSAGFGYTGSAKLPAACSVVDAGACVTTSCPNSDDAGAGDAGDAGGGEMAPNPGTITVTGGVFGTTGTGIAPDKGGTYLYDTPGSTIFKTGDTLGVAGAGATVPAFPSETVVALEPVKLTAPVVTAGSKVTIPTTADLTVSWTGGTAGAKLYFNGAVVFTSGGVAGITCSWDASLGTATVPKAALVPLVASNASGSDITWYQAAQTSFSAGAWPVTLSVYTTQGSLAVFQ